jgi:hypothetical protein
MRGSEARKVWCQFDDSRHQNAAVDFAIVTKRFVSYYEVDGYNGEVAERLKAAVC